MIGIEINQRKLRFEHSLEFFAKLCIHFSLVLFFYTDIGCYALGTDTEHFGIRRFGKRDIDRAVGMQKRQQQCLLAIAGVDNVNVAFARDGKRFPSYHGHRPAHLSENIIFLIAVAVDNQRREMSRAEEQRCQTATCLFIITAEIAIKYRGPCMHNYFAGTENRRVEWRQIFRPTYEQPYNRHTRKYISIGVGCKLRTRHHNSEYHLVYTRHAGAVNPATLRYLYRGCHPNPYGHRLPR